MSVHCRISNVPLLVRVLHSVALSKEVSAALFFLQDVAILHASTEDHASTASATIPKSALFSEYVIVGDPRFTVRIGSLLDALLMAGAAAATTPSTKFLLAFPTSDGRVLVEIEDHHRTLQTTIATNPVRERLLDLRFADALAVNMLTLRSDAMLEYLNDLQAFQCTQVRLEFTATHVRLVGLQSSLGKSVHIALGKTSDVVFRFDVSNPSGSSVYRLHHLLTACGSTAYRGSTRPTAALGGGAGEFGIAAGGGYSGGHASDLLTAGFERLTLTVNSEKQLAVVHHAAGEQPRGGGASASVTVVVSPLCDLADM